MTDPWRIIELLAMGIIAIVAWVYKRDADTMRADLHKVQGRVDMLMVNDGRAAERDAQFTKAIDELKDAVTEVSKVVSEVNMLVRTVRRMSPGEMPAVRDKRRDP